MKFASKDLCEKLVKMGCKSEARFGWGPYKEPICLGDATFTMIHSMEIVPAFTLEDFVANTEQARENARIVWGTKDMTPSGYRGQIVSESWLSYNVNRHAMIDAPDPWKFLEETMRKK